MRLSNRQYFQLAVILAALGVAVIVAVWLIGNSRDSSDRADRLPEDIIELIPPENGNIPRQSTIGIELRGIEQYVIRLWLNGAPIPEAEADISNTRFTYNPDEGKTFEQLEVGPNRLRVEYRRLSRPEDIQTYEWSFTAN